MKDKDDILKLAELEAERELLLQRMREEGERIDREERRRAVEIATRHIPVGMYRSLTPEQRRSLFRVIEGGAANGTK